jgi:L-seryl-tRNA(Ser) seleniumtransferase
MAAVTVKPGDVVIGVSASHSHPSVSRAVASAGGTFIDVVGAEQFEAELARHPRVALVMLTRLAVTYEILELDAIRKIIAAARSRGITVYADDAGGARVGPAIFDQPRLVDLGCNVVATGLDKYGTRGPRLGLVVGDAELIGKIRARSWEYAMEARPLLFPAVVNTLESYTPQRVVELVTCTKELAAALRTRFGDAVSETPVIAAMLAEDILELAMRRAGITSPPIVPFEATVGLCMLLLQDYGMLTVHFVGVPPGTADLLVKFIPPETLASFGGSDAYVDAIDASLDKLAKIIDKPEQLGALYFG